MPHYRSRGKYLLKRKPPRLNQSWKTLNRDDRGDLINLIKVLGITLAVVAALYFLGINGLTYIGGFWNLFTGESGPTASDTVAPPPPNFNPVSSYTKNNKINLSGYAEPASEIILFVNEEETAKTIAEVGGGTFSFSNVILPKEGKNTITATATDRSGNISQKSAELIVTFDKKPPKLEITSPKPGQSFSGDEKQIHVTGKTEVGAIVKVNEIQAPVLADGTFKLTINASSNGEIKITVVATDKAGNEKEVELTVNYSP